MLQFDEVLKIQVHDLCVEKDQVVLYLTFYLWVLPSNEAHICPAWALAAWLQESKLTTGYLFRKVVSGDCIAEANSPMVCYYFVPLCKYLNVAF